MIGFFFIIIGINGAHGHIDQRILHSGVLPVNNFAGSVRQNQKVVRDAVNVGQAGGTIHLLQKT